MSKSSSLALLKKLIPWLFYGLLAVFLYFYIKEIDFAKLQTVRIAWEYIFIGTILSLAFRYWGTFIWFVMLKGLGAGKLHNIGELVYVYAKSWLGRYIPGTAPWILGKIYFASQQGISKNKLAISSLLEGTLQIVVVMASAFLLLIIDPRLGIIDERLKITIAVIIVLCAAVMIPAIFNRLIGLAYKLLRKKTLAQEDMANSTTILKGASLYVFGAILSGLSLFFIAKAVYPELAYENMLFVMGAANLASAASMLAFFSPSGLGVREGIQLVLLALIMPMELALVVTVVMRLWSIVIDFLFFGLGAIIRKIFRRA